jgi:hypothetical protein
MRHTDLIRRSSDLRTRLAGDWGLLFSHPADFEQRGFESDRWLWLLGEAFAAQRVLPLVDAARIGATQCGWEWSIDPRSCYVGTPAGESAWQAAFTPLDRGPVPRQQANLDGSMRYVACIDPEGRCAAVTEYQAGERPRSLFDLLGLVARLARRQAIAKLPHETRRTAAL